MPSLSDSEMLVKLADGKEEIKAIRMVETSMGPTVATLTNMRIAKIELDSEPDLYLMNTNHRDYEEGIRSFPISVNVNRY